MHNVIVTSLLPLIGALKQLEVISFSTDFVANIFLAILFLLEMKMMFHAA